MRTVVLYRPSKHTGCRLCVAEEINRSGETKLFKAGGKGLYERK